METVFKEITPENINDNVFGLIGTDWMLITAGTQDNFNTMTANWGGLGYLWNKNVCFCFIRPPRYTYDFMEKTDIFTLSFFEEKYRDILKFCGAKSGRDVNKINETGLVPVHSDSGAINFKQARLTLECKKVYFHDITPNNFLDSAIPAFYPKKDYHRMYIGEIMRCLAK
ncbi:MAG: flavin reductase [Deltaproteobacteria bacterium]|nr:flavin reductase [Deltaproteobacteria bacterium]